ncbi:hypothetical protein ARMSODRAFT_342567 [Armillaria solidipes]|uniref:Uncharacterized protein n=1 Tax=Armillaria solidipes TaxID=1076256 RepID=A0A2H3BI77_9AGAR|nr:hypothetical protein ARMSODRAFT_342567 [Armillaria solidipes]
MIDERCWKDFLFASVMDLKLEPFVPHVEFEQGQASGAVVAHTFCTLRSLRTLHRFSIDIFALSSFCSSRISRCRSVINFPNTWVPCPLVGDISVTLPASLSSGSLFPQPEVTASAGNSPPKPPRYRVSWLLTLLDPSATSSGLHLAWSG